MAKSIRKIGASFFIVPPLMWRRPLRPTPTRSAVPLLGPFYHHPANAIPFSSSTSSSSSTSPAQPPVVEFASSVRASRLRPGSKSERDKRQREYVFRLLGDSYNGVDEIEKTRKRISAVVDELLALDDYVGIEDDEGDEVRRTHSRRRGDSQENKRDVVWLYQAFKTYKNDIKHIEGIKLIEFGTLKKIAVALSSESHPSDARSLIINEIDSSSVHQTVAASLIIQCYCISESVHKAESLFFTWLLLRHCKGYGISLELNDDGYGEACLQFMNKLLTLRNYTIYHYLVTSLLKNGIATLGDHEKSVFNNTLEGLDYMSLTSNDVPTEVWESMMKMYSNLGSSQSCQLLSSFYEGRYSTLPTAEMCHYTIRSLCAAKMYEEAMQYVANVRSLKTNGDDSEDRKGYSHMSFLAYMMGVLSNTNEVSDERFMTLYPGVVDAIIMNHEAHTKLLQRKKDDINSNSVENEPIRVDAVMNENKLDFSYQETLDYGMTPSMVAMLSNVLCLRGQLDKAARLLPDLHKAGVMITADAVEPIIDGYARFGEADEALKLFEWMIEDIKTSPRPSSYHSVCESMRNAGSIDSLAAFMTKYGTTENTSYNE